MVRDLITQPVKAERAQKAAESDLAKQVDFSKAQTDLAVEMAVKCHGEGLKRSAAGKTPPC